MSGIAKELGGSCNMSLNLFEQHIILPLQLDLFSVVAHIQDSAVYAMQW